MAETVKERIGIVLQARMGSKRLPGKVLMPLGGTTLLGWIVQRLQDLPWPLVIATSDQVQDDAIVRQCERMDVRYFRGSEEDVLDRYYQCAVAYGFAHVVRITGDNPFPDTVVLRQLVEMHLSSSADYTHSFGELPLGVGTEIFKFEALQDSWREGRGEHHREHVNEFIIEHTSRFRIVKLSVPSDKHAQKIRLTIDTEEDYNRIAVCLGGYADVHIGTEELIRRCSSFV
jgi:spore coat polysaccharide biosynthesis protein SpsF